MNAPGLKLTVRSGGQSGGSARFDVNDVFSVGGRLDDDVFLSELVQPKEAIRLHVVSTDQVKLFTVDANCEVRPANADQAIALDVGASASVDLPAVVHLAGAKEFSLVLALDPIKSPVLQTAPKNPPERANNLAAVCIAVAVLGGVWELGLLGSSSEPPEPIAEQQSPQTPKMLTQSNMTTGLPEWVNNPNVLVEAAEATMMETQVSEIAPLTQTQPPQTPISDAPDPAELLTQKLASMGLDHLNIVRSFNVLTVSGVLSDEEKTIWKSIPPWFDGEVGTGYILLSNFIDKVEDKDLPLRPRSVWMGQPYYIVDSKDRKIYVGEETSDGWLVSKIATDHVLFERLGRHVQIELW